MYRILGWTNVVLVAVMVLPFVIRFVNHKILGKENALSKALFKFLRKFHKPLGAVLFVSAVSHGFMALGSFRLHTGTLLGIIIIIISLFGITFIFLKKKWVLRGHKIFAILLILLLLVHLIVPSALYYLFGI